MDKEIIKFSKLERFEFFCRFFGTTCQGVGAEDEILSVTTLGNRVIVLKICLFRFGLSHSKKFQACNIFEDEL